MVRDKQDVHCQQKTPLFSALTEKGINFNIE